MPTASELKERFEGLDNEALQRIRRSTDYSAEAQAIAGEILVRRGQVPDPSPPPPPPSRLPPIDRRRALGIAFLFSAAVMGLRLYTRSVQNDQEQHQAWEQAMHQHEDNARRCETDEGFYSENEALCDNYRSVTPRRLETKCRDESFREVHSRACAAARPSP